MNRGSLTRTVRKFSWHVIAFFVKYITMAISGLLKVRIHQSLGVSNNRAVVMREATFSPYPPDSVTSVNRFDCGCRSLGFFAKCGITFVLFALAGCNGSDAPPVSHGGPVRDHVSLVETLRAQDLAVEPGGSISQPFFSIPGQILKVNGQDIQVFEFENANSTKSQAKDISPDGRSIGNTVVHWIDPPHFFLSGKVLVLYLGTDSELLKKLETVLGKPIAEANS